jgi:carboxypeptidase family protein
MSRNLRILAALMLGLLVTGSVIAGDNKAASNKGAIAGTFTDEDGKRLVAAEIRVESVGSKLKPVITKTDPQGRYWVKGLPIGDYVVTAYIDGSPVYRAKIRTSDKGYAKVDFDARLTKPGAGGADRMQRDLRFNSDSPFAGGRSGF